MKAKKRTIALLIILNIVVLAFLFCSQKNHLPKTRVVIAGSSCMGKMLSELTDKYTRSEKGWVQFQLGGTELGLLGLRQGVCDIASCSRELSPKEKEGIDSRVVAVDAIAVAVHPSNPINNISLKKLNEIYSGKITDWSELGASKMPIVVIGREAGSGTRSSFEAAIGLNLPAAHSQEHCETGMLRTAVATAPGAIGYLSFDYIDGSVKELSVDNVLPCENTVRSGRYPITRNFLLCTLAGEKRHDVLNFLDYVTGDEGCIIIRSLNMLPADSAKDVST